MTIRELAREAEEVMKEKGFYDGPDSEDIDRKLLLTVGEVVEAQNELRAGNLPQEIYFHDAKDIPGVPRPTPLDRVAHGQKPEGFGIELADVVIRVCTIAQHFGIDLQQCIEMKHAYNKTRPYRHGGKRF